MSKKDYGILSLLFALAVFIWLRNQNWLSSAEDSLPILAGLPVFVWLGWPWKLRPLEGPPFSLPGLALCLVAFLGGIILDLTLLMTIAWTTLVWIWLSRRMEPASLPRLKKLMVLPLVSFPWIVIDFERIGWWFRLSGAWSVEHLFALMRFQVARDGTDIVVQGLPMSVEAACSGLNALQSMLIAGTVMAFIFLGNERRYWWNLPLLVVMAWLANTLRIIVITMAALSISPDFAMGLFHKWSGWLVLCVMFCLCWLIFALQAKRSGGRGQGREVGNHEERPVSLD